MADISYFLKLGDILGESVDKAHRHEIDVISFGWGASRAESPGGGGGGAGKVDVDELTFIATSSTASPLLFLACATGRHLPEAVLTGRRLTAKGKAQSFLVLRLRDVTVTSYSQLGGDGDLPEDEVSLSFAQIEMTSSNGAATTMAGWDVVANGPTPGPSS